MVYGYVNILKQWGYRFGRFISQLRQRVEAKCCIWTAKSKNGNDADEDVGDKNDEDNDNNISKCIMILVVFL